MIWNKEKIGKHLRAAEILNGIKEEAFDFIRIEKRVSEWDVQQFIHKKFKENKLWTDGPQIVAFGSNSGYVHYFPKKNSAKKLKKNTVILIDIWGRLKEKNSPFADITWMGFCGDKIPREMNKVVNIVFRARDASLNFVKSELKKGKMPVGKEVDNVARELISMKGYGKYFLHSLGHGLGMASPHWRGGNFRRTNSNQIFKNVGYTIEPGIYLKGKFGARSEMDFYIDKNMKVVLSGPIQKKLICFGY